MTTTLTGQLEAFTYRHPQGHFAIARLRVAGAARPVTVKGCLTGAALGQTLCLAGSWETHPIYGRQFRIEHCTVTLPATVEEIRRYLASGIVPGIAARTAARLVRHFGAETLSVIEREPQRLAEVPGVGAARAAAIASAWREHHGARALMALLRDSGVKALWGARILELYGPEAETVLRHDPFRLVEDWPATGFVVADAVARHLGADAEDPRRVNACLHHLLQQAAENGHTYLPEAWLLERCASLFQIETHHAGDGVRRMMAADQLIREALPMEDEGQAVYLRNLHAAECGIAERLRAMTAVPARPLPIDLQRLRTAALERLALVPSPEQLSVIEAALARPLAVITGGPGTGKTTLIRFLVSALTALGCRVALAAPTGRAARRLAEVSGAEAVTLHRLLGFRPDEERFEADRDHPLQAEALIVDEASMVDTLLMHHLLQAVPLGARLILVGDIAQLPPVGPGNVLSDIIASARVPTFSLRQVFRQAAASRIVAEAHRVRSGAPPDLSAGWPPAGPGELVFIEESVPAAAVARIASLCGELIPRVLDIEDPLRDIQVLCPMHRDAIGTQNLNAVLQRRLNPAAGRRSAAGPPFVVGDKVMQLRNNYPKEVFNGEIGVVCKLEVERGRVWVDFDDRSLPYERDEFEELSLAYAITVHKAQGSEYPAVVLPLLRHHAPMLQRNLLYTAITRGQRLVVIVGTRRAVEQAVANDRPQRRLSGLAARLARSGIDT